VDYQAHLSANILGIVHKAFGIALIYIKTVGGPGCCLGVFQID